jgi:hypothetical protein
LPPTIFALPSYCRIDLRKCALSRITYGAIQRKLNARPHKSPKFHLPLQPRNYTETSLLEILDELYLLSDKQRPGLTNLFLSPEREYLRLFLHALRKTVHFEQGGDLQTTLAVLITDYLELADRNEEYRNLFFPIVEEACTTCGDKVVLYAIYLGVQKKLLEADLNDLTGLATLLVRGVWTLDQLRCIAEGKIAILREEKKAIGEKFKEEVQVYLGYLMFLKDRLQLPIDLGNMRFSCDVSDRDVEDAYNLVSDTLKDLDQRDEFLALDRLWRTALETAYPAAFREAMEAEDWVKAVASLTREVLKAL